MSFEKSTASKAYAKPVVLAVTKQGSNFSAGCQTKSGGPYCSMCRCS